MYGVYVYCEYNMSRLTVCMVYMCIVHIICPGSLCVWCIFCIVHIICPGSLYVWCICVLCIQYAQVHCVYGIYVYCVYNMSSSRCVWYICVLCM